MFDQLKKYCVKLLGRKPAIAAAAEISARRPRPTRTAPPACPNCHGQRVELAKVGTMFGVPVFNRQRCHVCGGAGSVPRVVLAQLGTDPGAGRRYQQAFPTN